MAKRHVKCQITSSAVMAGENCGPNADRLRYFTSSSGDLCLHPSRSPKPPWPSSRHHDPRPPAAPLSTRGCFYSLVMAWASNQPAPGWPRQGTHCSLLALVAAGASVPQGSSLRPGRPHTTKGGLVAGRLSGLGEKCWVARSQKRKNLKRLMSKTAALSAEASHQLYPSKRPEGTYAACLWKHGPSWQQPGLRSLLYATRGRSAPCPNAGDSILNLARNWRKEAVEQRQLTVCVWGQAHMYVRAGERTREGGEKNVKECNQ